MGHPLSRSGPVFLWFFAAVFLLLGLGYSSLTPVFENSDETLHYPFVKHLADGQGLPVATPGQLWNQEGTQPPLYYALVAASTFWLNTDNLSELLQRKVLEGLRTCLFTTSYDCPGRPVQSMELY